MNLPLQTVPVTFAEGGGDRRDYNIYIGAGTLAQAGRLLPQSLRARRLCIVTDETVAASPHLAALSASLAQGGYVLAAPIVLPAGEASKSFTQLEYVLSQALARGLDRASALVALGGGVIGDITGFAASILMRGIDFVQVPTTLLAQVDSSVGGKTGINLPLGKNLVGSFCQPRAVLIDTAVLATLPPREMRAGYAEVVKYGLINQPDFFGWLEQNVGAILGGDAAAQAQAIAESCRAKARIVMEDEREEKDIRALLNLGHTFGHALEKLGGYDGKILHGEAVSVGCLWALCFSVQLGLAPAADADRLQRHLNAAGMMTAPPFAVRAADILSAMRGDKKAQDGKLTLILMRGIGKSFVARDIDEGALLSFLEQVTTG